MEPKKGTGLRACLDRQRRDVLCVGGAHGTKKPRRPSRALGSHVVCVGVRRWARGTRCLDYDSGASMKQFMPPANLFSSESGKRHRPWMNGMHKARPTGWQNMHNYRCTTQRESQPIQSVCCGLPSLSGLYRGCTLHLPSNRNLIFKDMCAPGMGGITQLSRSGRVPQPVFADNSA